MIFSIWPAFWRSVTSSLLKGGSRGAGPGDGGQPGRSTAEPSTPGDALEQAVRLLESLVDTGDRTPLLARLSLGDLADRPGVERPLLGPERFDRLLRDWDVRLVVFALVVEEPRGQVVLRVKRVPVEAVVNELRYGLLAVDELRSERDRLSGDETAV
jgi:hypothetical protein